MNKKEFLKRIKRGLTGLPREEIQKLLDFYSEMIADAVEGGRSENEVIAELGYPEKISADYIVENNCQNRIKKPKSALNITLLILGSPIWLSIGAVILSCIIAVFAALFSVAVAVIAVGVGFVLGGAAGIVLSIPMVFSNFSMGIAQVGIFAAIFGIGLVFSFAIVPVVNAVIRAAVWFINYLGAKIKREPVQGKELKPLRINKAWTLTSAVSVAVGVVLFLIGLIGVGFDVKRFDTSADFTQENAEYEFASVNNINVIVDNAEVIVKNVDGDKIKVTYFTGGNYNQDMGVEGDTFTYEGGYETIEESFFDAFKKGVFYGSFNHYTKQIIIEVPASFDGNLTVVTDNGSAKVENYAELADVKLTTQNGEIVVTNVICDKLETQSNNGELTFSQTTANSLTATLDNGKIEFDALVCDAITVHTNNGAVLGSIKGVESDYTISAVTHNGQNNLTNRSGGVKTLTVSTDNGEINLVFTE